MTPRLKIRVRPDGERAPVLLSSDGIPLFDPTVYSLNSLRARNFSCSTISQHLRAIGHFLNFAEIHGIDIYARLREAKLLTRQEIDSLARSCHQPTAELTLQLRQHPPQPHATPPLANVETLRRIPGPRAENKTVHPHVAYTRLHSAVSYLEWLAQRQIYASLDNPAFRTALELELKKTLSIAKARAPRRRHHNATAPRQGLSEAEEDELLATTKPGAPQNPWRNPHTQIRNSLIVQWFLEFGLRRGELLALRIPDINIHKNTVLIEPRPHNPQDPRRYQPLVKTLGRELDLSQKLRDLTRTYIIDYRPLQGHARRHDFLLVASQTGAPLSLMAVGKMFETLRRTNPNLPQDLSAHILRHTWNDRFSQLMDKNRIPQPKEQKFRSYIMGWSETSNTSAIYTARHTREQANRALRELHRSYTNQENHDP